jgi:hypothetical protein
MPETTPTTTHATRPTNGTRKERKQVERLPRTPAEVALGQCNAVLKKIDESLRKRVVKTLVALHGVDE